MTAYNQMIVRNAGGTSPDPLQIPEKVSRTILEETVKQSAILQLARTERMSSRTERMPAIDLFPTAVWLGDNNTTAAQEDTALKQTTTIQWKNITMEAREIAVMVPVADAYVADSGFDLLGLISPRIGEAIGAALDSACFFNVNNPWKNNPYAVGIYQQAVTAGNVVVLNHNSTDIAHDVAEQNYQLASKGFDVNGYASQPGFQWLLAQERTSQGVSPYAPASGVDQVHGSLFGYPFRPVNNGSWDPLRARLFAGDWSKVLVGIRQDLTMRVFDSAIIQDQSGAIVYNAMQQDGKVLRVVARFAFAVASYKTILNPSASVFPISVLQPSGAPSS